jgi:hypothetical protein
MKTSFSILVLIYIAGYISGFQCFAGSGTDTLKSGFMNPPADCWPHTRWWWPGNPVSKEEITRELVEMRNHGIRGVEQITMGPVFEKGNIPYLSDEYMKMLRHMVKEAKRLGMEVSLNFGGPGWIIGGEWVPESDKSKDMVPTFVDLTGNQFYKGSLPETLIKTERSWEHYTPVLDGNETLIAVIAGKIEQDGIINEKSLINLTDSIIGKSIEWKVPKGEWRLMAFWLKKNGIGNAVDHFSKSSMERYCEYLGSKFYSAVGDEFGKTVESLFADSFELANLSGGINWSEGLMKEFKSEKGYDLTLFLPAIWWEVGDISSKIRYDVNEFLHTAGMKAFFSTFLGWCEKHNILGRIQPYGFNTDNIEASGKTHIPEMEITAGEKDAADWFDTRIGPRKYVASGAHLYGRKIISAEAYTFIHWERYRETLEELKIASDGYLLSGATKFYNHGFSYSPEKTVSPTRSLPFAAYIQPQNVWWKYYPELASYIARCSFLLRQGYFAPDIALYSPLANQWALNVLNPRKWTREFDWGELGNLLISNGYDYDLINDDALQNMADTEEGKLRIKNLEYKILILPNIETIPVESFRSIEKFVDMGGVVIALERLPERSTGFINYRRDDKEVKGITNNLFNKPKLNTGDEDKSLTVKPYTALEGVQMNCYGRGRTYLIKQVINRQIWWDKKSSVLDPFINTIRYHIAPDFGIDFAYEGLRSNNGLTFIHRKLSDNDIYFVSNIRDKRSTMPVTFRVKNRIIRKWDPYTGEISSVLNFVENADGIKVPLDLAPYESLFLEFSPGVPEAYVTKTDFSCIKAAAKNKIKAYTFNNGSFNTSIKQGGKEKINITEITAIPAPFNVSGRWDIKFSGDGFPEKYSESDFLYSWTNDSLTRSFSGTARYELIFRLLPEYFEKDMELFLDLGKVGNIAEVILNDKNAGTIWMRDQKLDVTRLAKQGKNKLIIFVTNTLINRVSAMNQPPQVPDDLVPLYGNEDVIKGIPREFGFRPLPASGLLGPVRIIPAKYVYLK